VFINHYRIPISFFKFPLGFQATKNDYRSRLVKPYYCNKNNQVSGGNSTNGGREK
jgi:hypothetical protein